MTDEETVRSYYASVGDREWRRLESGVGLLEFRLTTRLLERSLRPNSRVLDIGGGPGRYALWLAERGHSVVLADLSPELLERARSRVQESSAGPRIEEIVVANACDLSHWPDSSFDAAVALGPFYHLIEEDQRVQAGMELLRVLRPEGLAVVAFMSRFALLARTIMLPDERHQLMDLEWTRQLLDHGRFVNSAPGRFNAGYGAAPADVASFMQSLGFQTIEVYTPEALGGLIGNAVEDIGASAPELYARVLDLLDSIGRESTVIGTSSHFLYVGRRPP